jgi:signal transduction histidine kinase
LKAAMRRLYQKIYLTIVASLVLVVLVAGTLWQFGRGQAPMRQAFEMAGELASGALPSLSASRPAQQQAIEELARRLGTDVALFSEHGVRIAAAGRLLPPPPRDGGGAWLFGPGGPAWSFRLPDERWLVVRAPGRHRHPAIGLVLLLAGIALAVALGAYPVVRGLTRRLERLQAGVETLGAGNLAARVTVEGRDEVARLAESFNRSAARIEELMGAHRMLLANASHELRTPLARIRLGIELMQQSQDPKIKAALERDISELDQMIDELLLASRLGAVQQPQMVESVDLLALAAEECARYEECTAEGEALTIRGERRLLARLVRNLLDNASRYGAPPIRALVRRDGARAILEVVDGGAGIPELERERVFSPFHRLGGDSRGMGLGLALVRQIARLHGGDAVVAPRPGHPSCFQVSLPLPATS